MVSKLRLITDIYGETLTSIGNNPQNWMSFLECAAMNYKYPFNDQVLIYAQRPNAIACAKIEAWNKQVNRWVNRGAKGIALLAEDNGYPSLRYVFDVADTNSKNGKSFRLWTVPKPYELDIIEALENKYGELEDKSSLGVAIKSVSKIIVEDNIQDYLSDLISFKESSFLKELDEDNIKSIFQDILVNSVSFSIIKRSGLEPNEYFTQNDFGYILNFNSYETITRIGIASSEIAEMGIADIYKTIKNLRINEIDKIRTFDNDKSLDYDISESKNIAERSGENEYNLYKTRGLRDTEYSTTRNENSSGGQIRNDEIEIFKREQESPIYNAIDGKQVSRAFDGNSEYSNNKSGTNNITDENQREDNRENETFKNKKSNYLNKIEKFNHQIEQLSLIVEDENDIENGISKMRQVLKDEEIKEFDKEIFDAIVDYVIIGSYNENRQIDQYMIKFICKSNFNFSERKELTTEKILENNDLSKPNTDRYIPILDFVSRQQFFTFEKDENGKQIKKVVNSIRVRLEMER